MTFDKTDGEACIALFERVEMRGVAGLSEEDFEALLDVVTDEEGGDPDTLVQYGCDIISRLRAPLVAARPVAELILRDPPDGVCQFPGCPEPAIFSVYDPHRDIHFGCSEHAPRDRRTPRAGTMRALELARLIKGA